MLRVAGLHKSYGDVVALDGVDFAVSGGEVIALLGPNGAFRFEETKIYYG